MNTSYGLAARREQYNRDSILSATPARLLTMLYDRLLLDLNRAHAAQEAGNWQAASENLVHAQAIVAELSSSLDRDAWEGSEGLLGLYTYLSTAMMNANVHRNAAQTAECIALLEPLRQAWHEAAAQLPAQPAPAVSTGGILGVG
jgi:flagellar protein FliS